jgi:hypothetical protein
MLRHGKLRKLEKEQVCAEPIRVKVSTMSTLLITNNLSVYKNVHKFLKVSTSLIANDLNVYINVKVIRTTEQSSFAFSFDL